MADSHLKIPVRCRYGLRALFDLAYHAAGGSAQVREIARRQHVPTRYLEQVMLRLKQDGLVVARRGRNGGYRLGRKAQEVTLGDVLRATSAPGRRGAPRTEAGQFPAAIWDDVEAALAAALDGVTLADVVRKGEQLGLPRGGIRPPMYFI